VLFKKLCDEIGYADYLGALQAFRAEFDDDPDLLQMSALLPVLPPNPQRRPDQESTFVLCTPLRVKQIELPARDAPPEFRRG
jgi:hypothetical protein